MPTAEQTDVASMQVGFSTDERLPAIRYKQGGRTVYQLTLTPTELIALVARPDPVIPRSDNRQIRLKHAKDFATYFMENDNWVIPGIILRAPGIFAFDELPTSGAAFGVLEYPKRKSHEIQILDGQHRILGFHIALGEIADKRSKAVDQMRRAERAYGKDSSAYAEAKKEVAVIERITKRFETERVSVEIQVADDMQARQMFVDIADNALGITESQKARFDDRKVLNRAVRIVLDHPLLKDHVDMNVDRPGQTNPNLFSMKTVAEIVRGASIGMDARIGRRIEKTLSEQAIAADGKKFLDQLLDASPILKDLMIDRITAPELRRTSMLGSMNFLRILAGVKHELVEKHAFTDGMVMDFFTALYPHTMHPAHENSIWINHVPAETFDLGAFSPRGRRQDGVNLKNAMIDWAIMKPSFLYEAPKDAPAVEVDEDEGIDFAPSHSTRQLEVELRNETDDIAAEATTRARAVKK